METSQLNHLNPTMKKLLNMVKVLELYHRHEVLGLDNIPLEGPALLVFNHSLATYDTFMAGAKIVRHTGRIPRGLGDKQLFKLPKVAKFCGDLGLVSATPSAAHNLLRAGELVAVAPGGMREALRPSSERYQIRWNKRRGFANLAIKEQVPVVLIACPRADDIYHVYTNLLTKFFYKNFHLPLPIFRGLALSLLPRPIKLHHVISEPILPPTDTSKESVTTFHGILTAKMEELMAQAY